MTKDARVRLTVWPVVAMALAGEAWTLKTASVFVLSFSDRLELAGQIFLALFLRIVWAVSFCIIACAALAITAHVANVTAAAIRQSDK